MSHSPDLDDLRYEREDRREAERDARRNANPAAFAEQERLDAEWSAKQGVGWRRYGSRQEEEKATRLEELRVQRKAARDAMSLTQRIETIEAFCEELHQIVVAQSGARNPFSAFCPFDTFKGSVDVARIAQVKHGKKLILHASVRVLRDQHACSVIKGAFDSARLLVVRDDDGLDVGYENGFYVHALVCMSDQVFDENWTLLLPTASRDERTHTIVVLSENENPSAYHSYLSSDAELKIAQQHSWLSLFVVASEVYTPIARRNELPAAVRQFEKD